MICNIPKEDTYDLPEGRYNAVLASVRIKPQLTANRSDQLHHQPADDNDWRMVE
jgi:hypothetical protein